MFFVVIGQYDIYLLEGIVLNSSSSSLLWSVIARPTALEVIPPPTLGSGAVRPTSFAFLQFNPLILCFVAENVYLKISRALVGTRKPGNGQHETAVSTASSMHGPDGRLSRTRAIYLWDPAVPTGFKFVQYKYKYLFQHERRLR